jgi:hypothetical protein
MFEATLSRSIGYGFLVLGLACGSVSPSAGPAGSDNEAGADHHGLVALALELSTSKGFVSHVPNRNKMRELVAQEPDLVGALSKVKSYFNPFTEAL